MIRTKTVLRIVAALACLFLVAGCDEPVPLSKPLAELFPVDGVVDFSALNGVHQATLTFSGSDDRTRLTWAVMNDDRDLYVAVQWTDATYDHTYGFNGPVVLDGVQLLLDNDGDGMHAQGEDKRTVFAADAGAYYIDQHLGDGDETDAVGDGRAWLTYSAANSTYQAEFLFPLTADALGQDADVRSGTRLNIVLLNGVRISEGSGAYAALKAATTVTTTWPRITLAPQGTFARPDMPTDLTGLIVFTSTHEDAQGEIYTFDPATGDLVRVTDNDLFEENVSLSPDRTRIAFHGAPDKTAYDQYEIYTIAVDGSSLAQLTDNSLLDGHPAWSPDGSQLAYSSFRDDSGASIVVMTAEGIEIADLTPPGTDDNDADWLPDGRLVFKTNRFSSLPELRIAVMDSDGGNVEQLSTVEGVVDHDPMGNRAGVVFERLMAPLSYTEDITALFTPWNIVEVSLSGLGERTLVADRWVNWLPVYDPTGKYIVYLKNLGGTEARLISADGTDLGRLIPDITSITYLDWK